MIYELEWLIKFATEMCAHINGRYVPARPVLNPFPWRLRAAWEVLRGRADAFRWPSGQ